jgi:O-antigen/teichoic acid export membrane protein
VTDQRLTMLARGGTLNLVGGLAHGGLALLLVVVVTRGFVPEVSGVFFAAMSLFLILGAGSAVGADTGLVRFVPRSLVLGHPDDVVTTVRLALRRVVAISAVVGIGLVVAAPWVATVMLDDPARRADLVTLLRVFGALLPAAAATDTLLAATRGFGTMRPTVFVDRIARSALQPILVAGVAAAGAGVLALAVSWALPHAFAAAAAAWLLLGSLRRLRSQNAPAPAPPPRAAVEIRREFWSFAWPRAIARLFLVALQRLDVVLVAALRSPAEAAIYAAATRLVQVGLIGIQAIQQVLQPLLSGALAADDRASAQRLMRTTTMWNMALAWPVYLLMCTAAPVFLQLFGNGYPAGATVVVILTLAMLVAAASGPVDIVILMAGRSRLSLLNSGIALATAVVLGLILIPRLGVVGGALAWAAAIVLRNVLPLVQVRRILELQPWSRGAAHVAVSAALAFAAVPLLARAALGTGVPAVAVGLAVGCPLYAAALWQGRGRIELDTLARLVVRKPRRRPKHARSSAAKRVSLPSAQG